MAMRLQEVHPSLVHFPIALLPTSLAADALGRMTGSRALLEVGRRTMPVAAGAAVVAGLTGLVAQQTVNLSEHTTQQLITHRNINLTAIALTLAMASKRSRRARPSLSYLAVGAAGLAAVSYSAYLGGHMVYEHGVGVRAAGGVDPEAAPELTPGTAGESLRKAGRHLREGFRLAVQELQQGKLLPWLTDGSAAEPRQAAGQPA